MTEKIVILDFGSQYTRLIARSVRAANVFSEIIPGTKDFEITPDVKGIILSGSPLSVLNPDAPKPDVSIWAEKVPVLAICYGAQLVAHQNGGKVVAAEKREYGRAELILSNEDTLTESVSATGQVWMSHGDTIENLPTDFQIIARTENIPVAAYKTTKFAHPIYGLQFHPEVTHSSEGAKIIQNFLVKICHCQQDFTPNSFIEESIEAIKKQAGNGNVVMALSGGVDSTVAATLIHQAIGERLHCIFVDHGLLRKNEFKQVLESYKKSGLNVKGVEASMRYYQALDGVKDPETKRKIIGGLFIDIFQEEAQKIPNVTHLGQGTIYPDVIESMPVSGQSAKIKSHHNVGGLPEKMNLQLIEPLRLLFKDEVRKIGNALGVEDSFLKRHPFPGPGLGIRILGPVSAEKVRILQDADDIYMRHLKESGQYDQIWQAGAILLPVQSVGVMGDERTYEYALALRAVTSVDGMTADWAHLPYDLLAKISNDIINQVKGINRVVLDISSKPPSTIEWE